MQPLRQLDEEMLMTKTTKSKKHVVSSDEVGKREALKKLAKIGVGSASIALFASIRTAAASV